MAVSLLFNFKIVDFLGIKQNTFWGYMAFVLFKFITSSDTNISVMQISDMKEPLAGF